VFYFLVGKETLVSWLLMNLILQTFNTAQS